MHFFKPNRFENDHSVDMQTSSLPVTVILWQFASQITGGSQKLHNNWAIL